MPRSSPFSRGICTRFPFFFFSILFFGILCYGTRRKIDWFRKLYVFDEAENTKKFYTDLTDDDIKYLEAATRHDWPTCNSMLDTYFRKKMPNTVVMHKVWRRDGKNDIWE